MFTLVDKAISSMFSYIGAAISFILKGARTRKLEENLAKSNSDFLKLQQKLYVQDQILNEKEIIISNMHQALEEAIILSLGKNIDDPPSQHEIDHRLDLKMKALQRNNLKELMHRQISHRFGRMTYKADYTNGGGEMVWEWGEGEWLWSETGEKTILGSVRDEDGNFIDYSRRVQQLERAQLEQKASYNTGLRTRDHSGEQ